MEKPLFFLKFVVNNNKICYIMSRKHVRKTEYFGLYRELVYGESKLERTIQITFKLRFMDKINTVTRYSLEIRYFL